MPTSEQSKLVPGRSESAAAARALDTAAKATKLTQELRRSRPDAPRMATSPRVALVSDDEARERLERRISSHLPAGRLALGLTDNRFTMISVKRDLRHRQGPVYRVRLHHMFVGAPPSVTRSLARYIACNESTASRELSRFIEDNQTAIRRAERRPAAPVMLDTRGEVFDLEAIFAELNRRYFGGAIDARITWGARGGRRRRRSSIKMGSYSVEDRLIRIHPGLDRDFVPRLFLDWIVFHEMLHQVHEIPVVDGRRIFHTPAFVAAERKYQHYDLARQWERKNLDKLLFF